MSLIKTVLIILLVYGATATIVITQVPIETEVLLNLPGVNVTRQHIQALREWLGPLIGCVLAGLAAIGYIALSFWLDERSPEAYRWWKIWR